MDNKNDTQWNENNLAQRLWDKKVDSEFDRLLPIFIILTTVLCIISVNGGIGNLLVIYVFKKNIGKSSLNIIILTLAIIDFTTSVGLIPITLYLEIWKKVTLDFFCKFHLTLKSALITASTLTLTIIAIDRCLLICFIPGLNIPRRVIWWSLVCMIVVSITLALPFGLREGTFVARYTNGSSDSGEHIEFINLYSCGADDRFINDHTLQLYQKFQFFFFILMFIALLGLYAAIFAFILTKQKRLKKKYKVKTKVISNKNGEQQIPILLSTTTLETRDFDINTSNTQAMSSLGPLSALLPDNTALDNEPNIKEKQSQQLQAAVLTSHRPSFGLIQNKIEIQRRKKPHIKTAQALCLISAAFAVSYAPYLLIVNNMILTDNDESTEDTFKYQLTLKYFLFYLYFLNSSLNPIIHACTNKLFRDEVRTLFRAICR